VILESGGDGNILNKKMQEFDKMIEIALKAYDKSTDLSRRDILNIVEFIILAHLNHYSNIEESTSIAEIDVEQMLKNEDNRLDVGLLIARVSSMIGANMQMVHEIHHELNRFIKKEIEWSSLSTATKLAYIIRRYPILGFTQSTHEEIIARLEKELGNDPVFDLLKGILNN
jgi:hypothetical protein